MTITFLRRDEPRPDELTIRIYTDAGSILGAISCPEGLTGSHTAAEADHDGALGVHQALASAIALAGKHDDVIGVVDEEGLWRAEWGELA